MARVFYTIETHYLLPPNEHGWRDEGELRTHFIRRTEPSALSCLEAEVYDVCEAQGLRDRQIAHDSMRKARCWTKNHPILPITIGDVRISIKKHPGY